MELIKKSSFIAHNFHSLLVFSICIRVCGISQLNSRICIVCVIKMEIVHGIGVNYFFVR